MSFTNDKFLHFIISFMLVFVFTHFVTILNAALITFAIGIVKEIYDLISPHHDFDWYDIIANVGGILCSVILFSLFL